jgi:hypothetical protein
MNTLPDIRTLYAEDVTQDNELNFLLNTEPKREWVREHPYIKGYKYIPIDKIEFLLRKIFIRYKIEVTGQGTAFNGVWVTVRVHYVHPVLSEWMYHDGIGACQLQTKSGTSPSDLININNGAISMAFPIAKTIAIKDACDHFGKLFGCDLNRKDTIPFDSNFLNLPEPMMTDSQRITITALLDRVINIDYSAKLNIENNLAHKSFTYGRAVQCIEWLNNQITGDEISNGTNYNQTDIAKKIKREIK